MTAQLTPKLTLGPVLFHWSAEKMQDFYARIADEAEVDIVYLGEIVCSKRAPFFDPLLPDIIERLQRGGKEVVLSSRALVMTEREARMTAGQIAGAGETGCTVEANDLGAVRRLAGRPHVIGPYVNVYNEGTLAYLARQGAIRVCLPPELPGATINALVAGTPVPLEVLAFGRMPLAISARCFHARAEGLHKDSCRYACGNDPDGCTVRTLDGEAFLAINGTQTLSQTCLNLSGELPGLAAAGIRHFRLSPQAIDMVAVSRLFRGVLDGGLTAAQAEAGLAALAGALRFSNGFVHGREGRALLQAQDRGASSRATA
ncbi:MAG: U32 family peptidase [Ferrovibrio sp.]|uniref:ubiquinone anaerobic biosynthesis protein UbiV n=1 Tax=Ferrovibrio sp. TaxID=1917215 RepID=UPI0026223554|nr:U32 family peptidase [Ferrovibrio sp.]MCW0234610.1 U32 family peptidase [Ferrovibrio sp.]